MKNEGDQHYRNAPKGVQFAMRFAAMLIVMTGLTGIAKVISILLGTNFTDMLIVVFFSSHVLRDIKGSLHK